MHSYSDTNIWRFLESQLTFCFFRTVSLWGGWADDSGKWRQNCLLRTKATRGLHDAKHRTP